MANRRLPSSSADASGVALGVIVSPAWARTRVPSFS
jgi:hypothetical protein